MASTQLSPLHYNVPIVDPATGNPNPYFIQWFQQFLVEKAVTDDLADTAVPESRLINTTAPIAGGGSLAADLTLSHANSGVTANTYGDATHVPRLTVDAKGHITAVTAVAITGGSGKVTSVGTASVAGAAATTLTLSGLDLNTDQRWFIRGSFHNATISTSNLSLFYNADTTATNYNDQIISAINTTVNGSRNNFAIITGMDANNAGTGAGDTEFWGWIFVTRSGFVLADIESVRTGNTTMQHQRIATQWRTAGTNVTGITISASVASSLDIGGKIELWKLST